jgi:hypothetical protein
MLSQRATTSGSGANDVNADVSQGKRVKLIVAVDTEEDNWGSLSLTRYTCANIERIPAVQGLFDHFDVIPTYLVTYPVATDEQAASILKAIVDTKRCEVGAQCHPWNTPPLNEENTPANSMLCNLPAAAQYAKMKCLHEAIRARFGVEPISFKSGRFGYSPTVARNLHRLGYKIDNSITPYMDWTRDQGPDFTRFSPRPFRFSSDDAFHECASGDLVEVPSTIGFLQHDFVRSNYIFDALTRGPIRKLRLAGVLHWFRLLNKAWLSPELSNSDTMIRLARAMMRNGYDVLTLVFHSPSLKAGLTPFTRTEADERRLFRHLREFLVFARDAGIEPVKLSDVQRLL